MTTLLQIVMGLAGVGIVLALVSGGFADGLSRAFEAALDAVEYRLALKARGRAARNAEGAGGRAYGEAARVTG